MKQFDFLRAVLFVLLVCGCDLVQTDSDSNSTGKFAFREVSALVNLEFLHQPGVDSSYFLPEIIGSGCAFLDYDNDGDLDIYLVNGNLHGRDTSSHTNRLFRQDRDRKFSDVTAASGLGDTGYGMGVAVGDIDNDGFVDVYITNYGPDALYLNNGNGTFTSITEQAGISNPHWGCSAVFFDYNLDGFLDLYVTNYLVFDPVYVCIDRGGRREYCSPGAFSGVPDVLYRNNGDGTFSDVSVASNIAHGSSMGLGVVSADFNGDGFPDLYVANDAQANHLWINQQDGTFRDQALGLGTAFNKLGQPEASMGIALGDMDSDHDLDLFITHLKGESNTLYRYAGEYGFQDDSRPAGVAAPSIPFTGFGTGFFDFDHDGDLDLAIANGRVTRGALFTTKRAAGYWDDYAEPNFLFENVGSGLFSSVEKNASAFLQPVENSRGLAFGDVDGDGDIDLLVSNEGGRVRLYLNEIPDKGNWLIVRAIDPDLHRDAIGATVIVTAAGKQISRLITPSYSYLSSNDPRAHFGLGPATAVDEITVLWPTGNLERFPGVDANRIITIRKKASQTEKI